MGIENMNGGSWIEFNKLKGELRMDRARRVYVVYTVKGHKRKTSLVTYSILIYIAQCQRLSSSSELTESGKTYTSSTVPGFSGMVTESSHEPSSLVVTKFETESAST
ncbi:hypothetical protein V8G54_005511 [Vigna mungo]|uniref:Uncharacterized protein n=1 Tax=Vigna mungo TaxID=3915 RepID=A0AAQ3S3T4_VIGMU